ncbi:MAG: hypothetical protein ACUVX9_03805 [Anaerolineae bacterium]
MRQAKGGLAASAIILLLFVLLMAALSNSGSAAQGKAAGTVFLPLVQVPAPTPTPSCGLTGAQYISIGVMQYDEDNPVRPAASHADKNLGLRGYVPNTDSDLQRDLVSYNGSTDPSAPQLATLFSPARVPSLVGFYRVHSWIWAPSSVGPGQRGAPLTTWRVTALGFGTAPGEVLRVPQSGYMVHHNPDLTAIITFADEDSITIHWTREDTSALGYTLHVDGICTDPNLLALYRALDGGARYEYHGRGWWGYSLPALGPQQPFGTARTNQIVVAISDAGNFMDPRSCRCWWQIRPGYQGTCPPARWPAPLLGESIAVDVPVSAP